MDFKDEIKKLGEQFVNRKDKVTTEEGTKTSFVLPFIRVLGYDDADPCEVMPEFTTDIGMKKGEKVDYAILSNEKPIIIIECKHLKEKLDVHKTQLERYFHVTDAKFAILTNGQTYRFYTDLVAPNKMDIVPFLEIDITDFKEIEVLELSKFQKSRFDANEILAEINANKINLNYTNQLTEIIKNELNQPSDSFVNFFISKLSLGVVDAKVIEKFSPILKEILQKIIDKMAVIPTENTHNEVVAAIETTQQPKLSDYTNDDIKDKITKYIESRTPKSVATLIKVTFDDKSVICDHSATETYVKTLQMIGLDKIKTLGMLVGGIPLIGDKKDKKYYQYQVADDIFIMTSMSTDYKIKKIKKISDSLNLGLIIEKIG